MVHFLPSNVILDMQNEMNANNALFCSFLLEVLFPILLIIFFLVDIRHIIFMIMVQMITVGDVICNLDSLLRLQKKHKDVNVNSKSLNCPYPLNP
jgi:hypothetical protein